MIHTYKYISLDRCLEAILQIGHEYGVLDHKFSILAYRYLSLRIAPLAELMDQRCHPENVAQVEKLLVTQTILSMHVDYLDDVFDKSLSPVEIIRCIKLSQTLLHIALICLEDIQMRFDASDWSLFRQFFEHEINAFQGKNVSFDLLKQKISFMLVLPQKLVPQQISIDDLEFYQKYLQLNLLLDDLDDLFEDQAKGYNTVPVQSLSALSKHPRPLYHMRLEVGHFAKVVAEELFEYAQQRNLCCTAAALKKQIEDLALMYKNYIE